MPENDRSPLNVAGDNQQVPTFACIVYISQTSEGIRARVANLPDLESTGSSEREALSKLVPEFKRRIAQSLAAGEEIRWIDPPSEMLANEQKRFVPVHL